MTRFPTGKVVWSKQFALESRNSSINVYHTSSTAPLFFNSRPSILSNPKLMSPLPVFPLPILIAQRQRVTNSLISADSLSFSDVTRSCMRNDEAIAKFARDPGPLSPTRGVRENLAQLTRMPKGVQCSPPEVLHKFNDFFGAFLGTSSYG